MKDKRWLALWVLGVAGCSSGGTDCGQLAEDLLVGNAGCLISRPGAVLMVQQQLSGSWALPGGTSESGERAACTAIRETQEETGLAVHATEHLITLENGFHIYRCEVPEDAPLQTRDGFEIRDVAWKSAAERAELLWRFPEFRDRTEALMQRYESPASHSSHN